MSFRLTIRTPDVTFFDDAAEGLVVPGAGGYFGVLSRHAPMLASLSTGILKAQVAGQPQWFVLQGGIAEVTGEQVSILADHVVPASDPGDAEEKLQELLVAKRVSAYGA